MHIFSSKCTTLFNGGGSYPDVIRKRVPDLAHAGTRQRQIATELRVSRGYVQKRLEDIITKTFQYEVPVLAFLSQKLPAKSSSLLLLRK